MRSLSIMFMFLPVSAMAGLYPVMVEVDTQITSASSAIYHIKQELIEIGDASEIPVPGPGYIIMGHRHFDSTTSSYWTSGNDKVYKRTTIGQTVGEAARDLYYTQGAKKNTLQHVNGPNNLGECVGYAWGVAAPISRPWESVIFPPGTCTYVPPGRDWCQIVTPEVVLDHGQLSILPNGTQMSNKTADMDIDCTSPMSVRVVFGDDVVNLGVGIQSSLKLARENKDGFISLNAGVNHEVVSSDLTIQKFASSGDYSGSTVVFITYY
ncbi:hypothetical protein I5K87_19525 [Serratia marcescens]|uniref:Uncharacterized protein n=2 Tax=Serratia TaxID=613 RepID=A0A5C7CHB8_SERMA|nr:MULTISPECIES: hypothetical protein [Serratia]MBH2575686.1 hypothetical protein [Serratia marcescens]MBH3076156.1 hypothetical protein [Serratia ureilytica]MBN5249568.1 hypothetical protein [Serratia marcescens]MBN5258777.1 hypothetical protein [Serratia marcescens]MBN5354342.1 hypothetical protein [Serratia marcescens]